MSYPRHSPAIYCIHRIEPLDFIFMKISVIQFWLLITLLASTVTASHRTRSIVDPKLTNTISLSRVFPTERNPSVTFDSSIIASPVLDVSQDQALIILPVSNGQIAALDSKSGRLVWDVHVPTSGNQSAQLISTPVKVNNKLLCYISVLRMAFEPVTVWQYLIYNKSNGIQPFLSWNCQLK